MAAVYLICALVLLPWHGFVASKLWGWFVASTFGLPDLHWAVAAGVMLLIGMGTHQYVKRDDSDIPGLIAHDALTPLLVLGVGYALRVVSA